VSTGWILFCGAGLVVAVIGVLRILDYVRGDVHDRPVQAIIVAPAMLFCVGWLIYSANCNGCVESGDHDADAAEDPSNCSGCSCPSGKTVAKKHAPVHTSPRKIKVRRKR
jgi:hypothetical protein